MRYKAFTELQGGEVVKITDGVFKDYHGLVFLPPHLKKGRLIAKVIVFGRITNVEIDFLQVARVKPQLCCVCDTVFEVDKNNVESYKIGKYLAQCPECGEKLKKKYIAIDKERQKVLQGRKPQQRIR